MSHRDENNRHADDPDSAETGRPEDPDRGAAGEVDDDERLGEVIETYLSLVENGEAPDPDEFADRYPDIREDVRAALEGLELVHGLVGSGSTPGGGPGRNLESGRRIAGYRVVRELGRGGMGTVYEAVHMGLDRPVALKVLGTHAAPDSSARRRFLNEAKTAAGLHHTHIVPVFDVGQAGGLCYYAMQRIEGSGLDQVLRHLRQARPGSFSTGRSAVGHRHDGGSGLGSASDISSRFNRLWVRVSSGLPWRHQPASSTDSPRSPIPSLDDISPPQRSLGAGDDPTGSWQGLSGGMLDRGRSRVLELEFPGTGRETSAPILQPHALDDTAATPFAPPRGSAYFRWVAEVGLQAAEALGHAHHQGVIHRDVKPSNLLIDDQGNIWVTDFGLARRLADPGMTHHDSLLGTPRYMSPEQARTGRIDARTDVYSLGATLYELLTLRPPFDGTSAAELLDQIGGREPLPPRQLNRRVPLDLETIVLKTLAKRPGDRYETAVALAEDLARFLNNEPVRARRISPVGRAWRVARRHPGITSVTTVASIAVLGIAIYAYSRILAERDRYRTASEDRAIALVEKETEAEKARAAARWALSANAANLLVSELPDRRSKGLDLLRNMGNPEAAATADQTSALSPEKLREQAVEFLMLRDVVAMPGFPTGSSRGIELGSDASVLAALSENGTEITLWNVAERQRFATIGLEAAPAASSAAVTELVNSTAGSASGARPNSPGGKAIGPGFGGRGGRWWGRHMTLARNVLFALLPDEDGPRSEEVLRLYDIRNGSVIRDVIRPGRRVQSVFSSPSGDRLITIEEIAEPPRARGPGRRDAGGPPSGRPESGEPEILLWDTSHLEHPVATLQASGLGGDGPRRIMPWPAFSPDSKSVALAQVRGTTLSVLLYDLSDGKLRNQIDTQSEMVMSVALGANNLMAVAVGNTIQLWDRDREGGRLLTSLADPRGTPRLMRFNHQGTLLATATINSLEIWDVASLRVVAVLPAADFVSDFGFTPDGMTLFAAGRMATTQVWHVNDSTPRVQIGGFESWPLSMDFRPGGGLALGCANGDVWFYRDGGNRCTGGQSDPATPSETAPRGSDRSRDRNRGRGMDKNTVRFDAEGRLLALDSHSLRVWNDGTEPGARPTTLELPGSWMMSQALLARSADGRHMAVVRGGNAWLWDSSRPDALRSVNPPPPADDAAPGPAPYGPPPPEPAGGRPRPGIDPGPGPRPGPGPGPPPGNEPRPGGRPNPGDRPGGGRGGPNKPGISAIQISPTGDRLYFLGDFSRLSSWALGSIDEKGSDLDGPITARRIDAPDLPDGLSSLALRPDGELLAIGDRTGRITLLDTRRWAVVGEFAPSEGEGQGVLTGLAFSPDGRRLAAGSYQGRVILWSVANPARPSVDLKLPARGYPWSLVLAFDDKGQRLAVTGVGGGSEPTVEIWDLNLIDRELERLGLGKH